MTGVLGSIQEYIQTHPKTVVAGFAIVLPGTYMLATNNSGVACGIPGMEKVTKEMGFCNDSSVALSFSGPTIPSGLSKYFKQTPDVRLKLPLSKWKEKPPPMFVLEMINTASRSIDAAFSKTCERIGLNSCIRFQSLHDRWVHPYDISRFITVAMATALPGIFLIFVRQHPSSWAARHQYQLANVLHLLALVAVATQKISIQDLLVTVLVLTCVEVWQRLSCSILDVDVVQKKAETGVGVEHSDSTASTESLQKQLEEAKTVYENKENDLKRTQDDLRNARETLTETFAEYSSLRDEFKTMKQNVGRDHQAVLYRKDIELFALRKNIEQKDNAMREKDVKVDALIRQHKAILDLRDAQVQGLKNRLSLSENKMKMDKQEEVNQNEESQVNGYEHAAVQVKLLRVRGPNSPMSATFGEDAEKTPQTGDEKDTEIARLKGNLADAERANEAIAQLQAELRTAGHVAFDAQRSLEDERERHAKTIQELEEVNVRLEAEISKATHYSPTQLPTIDEHDQKELEAMFNAAQQDNLRLHSEIESIEQSLREATVKLSTQGKDLESLKEQLRLEQDVNADMQTARPSLVHRVHFQRLEGQLNESRDLLVNKDEVIKMLHETVTERKTEIEELKKRKEATENLQNQMEQENKDLKKSVTELQTAKDQLMADHERLANARARQRNTSGEHDRSARVSGATLISDDTHPVTSSDVPPPPRPPADAADSFITTATTTTPRSERFTLISASTPPDELRSERRKSTGFRGLMKRMAGIETIEDKDSRKEKDKESIAKDSKKEKENVKANGGPSTPARKDRKEEIASSKRQESARSKTSTKSSKEEVDSVRPKTGVKAAKELQEPERPKTSGARPVSRGLSRKLVRRSLA